MDGSFDATKVQPKQLGESHPIGRFPFSIINTAIKANKAQDGGFFEVEFTSPAGTTIFRYNLWSTSDKAKEIANAQLSALCHATGIFKLDWPNEGAALRGGRGQMDIGFQKGQEPTQENPNGGYTEIKKVYDAAGNEPGKAPVTAPQPQTGWTAAPGAQDKPQPQQQTTQWPTKPADAPPPNPPQPQGWQQGGSGPAPNNPPWR